MSGAQPDVTSRSPNGPGFLGSLSRRPLLRVLVFYLALLLLYLLIRRYAPDLARTLSEGEAIHSGLGVLDPSGLLSPAGQSPTMTYGPGTTALVGMVAAFLLMLPVVWIYQFARQKRGYRQTLVQTLIILPIVVASVVSLVRNSVALAFSLGGIVGAVAFRHRLEDTKDAVYVFLAIAVGLAAGVQVFPVALSLSVFYNVVALLLWYTDFGRVPAELAGVVGRRRIELAREQAAVRGKQTGEFVSAVDEQILQSMTTDQLEALAERAISRRQKMAGELFDEEPGRVQGVLAVSLAAGASEEGLRRSVEQTLEREAKEWRLDSATLDDDGRVSYRYRVRTRKSVPRPLLVEAVRRATTGQAERVTFE